MTKKENTRIQFPETHHAKEGAGVPEKPKVYIQTFSGFDVFVNGRVIYFPSKKSKELNLYLNPRKKSYIQLFSHYQIYFNQQNHSLDMLIQPNI